MVRVLFLLLFPLLLFSNHLHWQGDYDKALHQAKKEKKPLLVLVVKADEPLCNEIIKNFFMNQPYIADFNQKSIAVMVRYEGSLSYPVELYYTTSFPTLFLVDSQHETFLHDPLYDQNITVEALSDINLTH